MADYPTPPPVPNAAPSKMSGLAIASLVLGILGICGGLTAILGLILGVFALAKIRDSKGALAGQGVALAGVIVSAVALILIPIFAAMMLPALAAAKAKAQTINCVSNEKMLALGAMMYATDHTNQFPPSATWCDAIKSYVGMPRAFKCPTANPADQCDYAFNAALGGMDESKVDPHTVLIFESDAGWNANGGPELMVSRHERGKKTAVAFADGHVEVISQSQLSTLRWNP